MNGIDERLSAALADWVKAEVESWVAGRAYRVIGPAVRVGSNVYRHVEITGKGCASAENAARALAYRLRSAWAVVSTGDHDAVIWRILPELRRGDDYTQTWSYYARLSFVSVRPGEEVIDTP